MKTTFIILAVLLGINLNAQDVSVTAFDAFPPSYTGSIEVNINPLLGNAPFIITVTRNSSIIHTGPVSDYNWTLGDLHPGYYCIHIESQDGCVASVCVWINRCFISTNELINCLVLSTFGGTSQVIVAGEPLESEGGQLKNPDNVSDFMYVWYTSIDSFFECQLATSFKDSTNNLVGELVNYGFTSYDTTNQSEIDNPHATFIISYNPENQEVNWVWHNFTSNQNRYIKDEDVTINQIKVFPNPTANAFTTTWPKGQFVSITVVDKLGRSIMSQQLESDANKETFSFDKNHAPGLHFLLFKGVDGSIASKKIMLVRDF